MSEPAQPRSTCSQTSFGIEGLWLDDSECLELLTDLYRVPDSRRRNLPGKGRRRRILASLLLPGDEATPDASAQPTRKDD